MWNVEQIIYDNTRQLKMEAEKRLIFCALKQIIDLYSNYSSNAVLNIKLLFKPCAAQKITELPRDVYVDHDHEL